MIKRRPHRPLPPSAEDWTSGPEIDSVPPAFTTLRRILNRALPDPEGLSETDLIGLLNGVEVELLEHGIKVDFLDSLPARVAYQGILQLLDSPIETGDSPLSITHLDGCDSACESCFQLAHCQVAREVLGGEWRLAVDQAGINPSWSALFSGEDEE